MSTRGDGMPDQQVSLLSSQTVLEVPRELKTRRGPTAVTRQISVSRFFFFFPLQGRPAFEWDPKAREFHLDKETHPPTSHPAPPAQGCRGREGQGRGWGNLTWRRPEVGFPRGARLLSRQQHRS